MSGPGVSSVICNPNGRHVVAQTSDSALVVALARAELDRRGIPRRQVEDIADKAERAS